MSDLLAMTDLETLIPVVREVSLLPAVS